MGSSALQTTEYKIDFQKVWEKLLPLKVQIGAPPDIYEPPIVIIYKYKTAAATGRWQQGAIQITHSTCFELKKQASKPFLIKLHCQGIGWLNFSFQGNGWVNNPRN